MKRIRSRTSGAVLAITIATSILLSGCGPAPTPQPSPVPPTAVISPAQASQTAAATPRIYDFSACLSTCTGSNGLTTFPANTETIYISWKWVNIPPGAHYVRTWTHETKGVWKTYDCAWDQPSAGEKDIRFFDIAGGLASGVWTLTMTVNNQVILEQKLTIQGTNQHWDPSSPISGCFS